jgi:hypothetical protein
MALASSIANRCAISPSQATPPLQVKNSVRETVKANHVIDTVANPVSRRTTNFGAALRNGPESFAITPLGERLRPDRRG